MQWKNNKKSERETLKPTFTSFLVNLLVLKVTTCMLLCRLFAISLDLKKTAKKPAEIWKGTRKNLNGGCVRKTRKIL